MRTVLEMPRYASKVNLLHLEHTGDDGFEDESEDEEENEDDEDEKDQNAGEEI